MDAREDELVDDAGRLLDRYKLRHDARRTVARKSADIDEEWEIVNALALLEDDYDRFLCADEGEDESGDRMEVNLDAVHPLSFDEDADQ
ncbi:hypothetical protein [Nonomuraea typhae]|uniref:Uncharacterized protein n=1 Tax=Nonomuraea typhae TaxID=2603600 RepID=A0ABW7YK34_9ACTN